MFSSEAMLCLKTDLLEPKQVSWQNASCRIWSFAVRQMCGSKSLSWSLSWSLSCICRTRRGWRPNVSSTKSLVIRRLNANMVQKSYNAYGIYRIHWSGLKWWLCDPGAEPSWFFQTDRWLWSSRVLFLISSQFPTPMYYYTGTIWEALGIRNPGVGGRNPGVGGNKNKINTDRK